MAQEWNLHYAEWMIGDGEPHRSVGQTFEWFAIDYWPPADGLRPSAEKVKSAIALPDFLYRASAEVVCVIGDTCVIDFGLRAVGYSDKLPAGCKPGDYVTGNICLNIADSIPAAVPQELMQSLTHKWLVKAVYADLTPYRELAPRHFIRDETKINYEEVSSTCDVNTHTYVLRCAQVG